MKNNIKILLLATMAFVSCEKEEEIVIVPEIPITAGSANFSSYVAVGNSLTAGFSDGALFKEGQLGSWTNILNEQFKLVEGVGKGGTFNIPFMPDNIGGIVFPAPFTPFSLNPRVYWNGAGVSPAGAPTTLLANRAVGSGFNNMGVPGAKSFHLLASGYGNLSNFPAASPYFARFCSSPDARIIDDATAQNAKFFTLWIGNNDILSYATTGGIGVDQTGNPNPTTYSASGNDITDPTLFGNVFNQILNGAGAAKGLASDGAQGVVCNIPYVTSIPFFTTVLPRQLPGLPASQVGQLNQLFGGINAALAGAGLPKRFEVLVEDDLNIKTIESNPLLIVDETLLDISAQITAVLTPQVGPAGAAFLGAQYGKARHARAKTTAEGGRDYILLTTGGLINPNPVGNNIQAGIPAGLTPTFAVRGVTFPLQDAAVLTADEASKIKVATDAYNISIKSLVDVNPKLVLVNTNAILNQVATVGVSSNGLTITSTYPTGGAFSLDGVHPSPRGYALIANKIIEAINLKFGSTLRTVDLNKYRVQYPKVL